MKKAISIAILLLWAIPLSPTRTPAQTPGSRPVTAEEKRRAVAELAKLLRARYAIPGIAETSAKAIETKLARGAYDAVRDAQAFGDAVTADLRAVTKDKHLKFGMPIPLSPTPPSTSVGAVDPEAERARRRAGNRRGNFGLPGAEVLPGNVGYLEVKRFQPPEEAGDTIVSAMGFLANTDAVIVDVRNCRGGSAYVMPIFAGYFLPRPTSLFDMIFRGDNFTERFWTAAWLPGKRLADVPMFILTSGYTFSGAEGFAYRFQVLKRAVIVGETTGGGANAGGILDVGPVFKVWMPMGRPVDADTGTNWEGTGVEPDIKAAAGDALAVAHIEALKTLKAKATNAGDVDWLDWALERARVRRPANPAPSDFARFSGVFGACRVWVEGGQLRIQRGSEAPFLLVSLSDTVFASETIEPVRLEFFADPDGGFSKIAFTDEDRIRGEYRKDLSPDARSGSGGPAKVYDLSEVAKGKGWRVVNRGAVAIEDGDRKAVRLDERPGEGLVWLENSRFAEGMIEFDMRGRDVFQRSFVGTAFHAIDDRTFEAVYFRPFNFKPGDPARAGRAVQYVSHPEYTWQKLRAEKPGQYERSVNPVPDPNGWFHVRVVVTGREIIVYVDGSSEPCLTAESLSDRREGMIGLMVGNGSGGDFADLRITPADRENSKERTPHEKT
jgi:retinol-binding protein 3